jgi:hypothetical protein
VIALSEFAYGVVIGPDAILLDVRADRYHAMVGAAADKDGPIPSAETGQHLVPEAWTALIEAGLASWGSGRGFSDLHRPEHALVLAEDICERSPLRDSVDLVVAIMTARWRMRKGLPCRSYHPTRSAPDGGTLAALHLAMTALRRIILFIPTPRRCLPASLITAVFLARRGVTTQIVFGVRSYPFEAHCWVEHDGVVVDDDLDKVCAFLPIVVGHP